MNTFFKIINTSYNMNNILELILFVGIFIFIVFIMINSLFQIKSYLNDRVKSNNNTLFYIGMIIEFMIIYCTLYYSIYLFSFNYEILKYSMLIIITVTNFYAIILSFHYFMQSNCMNDEGNNVAEFLYKRFGVKIGHLVLIAIRIIVNIVIGVFLFVNEEINKYIIIFNSIQYYEKWSIYCIIASIYIFEAIANIKALSEPIDKCDDISYLCEKSINERNMLIKNKKSTKNIDNVIYHSCPKFIVKRYLNKNPDPKWYNYLLEK